MQVWQLWHYNNNGCILPLERKGAVIGNSVKRTFRGTGERQSQSGGYEINLQRKGESISRRVDDENSVEALTLKSM